MAKTHKYRPKDILEQYNFTVMKGRRSSNRAALRKFYAANYDKLRPGLEEARKRLKMSNHASLKSVLYKMLDARVDGTIDTATSAELAEALKATIVKDANRGEIRKRGFMLSWSTAVGGPNYEGRPKKSNKYSDSWNKFVKESGWTGSIDDYSRLIHDANGVYNYTSKDGKKRFQLFFTVSKSLTATWSKWDDDEEDWIPYEEQDEE